MGVFRLSNSSPKPRGSNRESYSFLGPDTRARQVINSLEKAPAEDTDLKGKNRVSFGRASDEDDQHRISSRPIMNYSEEVGANPRFSNMRGDPHVKSQKYMNNVKMTENQYMDVQDVIRQNKHLNRGQL